MSVPKVFISYSTADRPIAEKMYVDLRTAGANVFQFERSAKPGSVAWNQALSSIAEADFFVILMTKSALNSNPVLKEIQYAFYRYVNNNKPTLIPAIVERIEALPAELEMFTALPFADYATGLAQLIGTLGLQRPQRVQTTGTPTAGGQPARSQKPAATEQRPDPSELLRHIQTSGTATVGGFQPKPPQASATARMPRRADLAAIRRARSFNPLNRYRMPDSAFRERITKEAIKGVDVDEEAWWRSFLSPGLCLAGGLVCSLLVYWLVGYFTEFLPEPLPGFLQSVREWIASLNLLGLSAWWILTLGGALIIIVSSFWFVLDETPVDFEDYVVVSAKAFVVAILVGVVWSSLCLGNVKDTAFYVAGAVALASVSITGATVFDEMADF